MGTSCVWPVAWGVACREPAVEGQLCLEHTRRVRARVGTADCAWPGCERRAWDERGLCSFHRQVAMSVAWA